MNAMSVDIKRWVMHPLFPKILFMGVACIFIIQLSGGIIGVIKLNKAISLTSNLPKPIITQKLTVNKQFLTVSLFGDYIPPNLDGKHVKKSMLDLKIVGIMFSNTEQNSNVIIREAGGKERTYHVGDKLPGGATIKKITATDVIVIRDGLLESLSLPNEKILFEEAPKKPLGMEE